ncbi:MAG: helix-turn-helix transcriptional regulator [Candidatus Aminicenantes bacterium]|nr:MAG: helix-turn-helix transcriptional regulator [Candidatus Aminicenantes bacterium]
MHIDNQIGERIRLIRKHYRLTQLEFGKRLGCSKSSIINYEKNARSPDTIFLVKLLKEFNVNANWLLLGTGNMFGHGNVECTLDDDVLQMVEHLQIPAIKLLILAEYDRIKKVFEPLIKDYEDKKAARVPGKGGV